MFFKIVPSHYENFLPRVSSERGLRPTSSSERELLATTSPEREITLPITSSERETVQALSTERDSRARDKQLWGLQLSHEEDRSGVRYRGFKINLIKTVSMRKRRIGIEHLVVHVLQIRHPVGASCPAFYVWLLQVPFVAFANGEGFGEAVPMRRIIHLSLPCTNLFTWADSNLYVGLKVL